MISIGARVFELIEKVQYVILALVGTVCRNL
jgi:hypothetical protein